MKNVRSLTTLCMGIMALMACAGDSADIDAKRVAATEAETLRMLSVHFLQKDDREAAIEALRAIENRSDDDEEKLAKLLQEERAQQERRFSVDGAHLDAQAQ